MEKENDYCVLRVNGSGGARVARMAVYNAWITAGFTKEECMCPNVTREEAHVFIKIMGLKDLTHLWETTFKKNLDTP